MAGYMAILFAPDGDFVTDYRGCDSIAEVESLLADQGSRWYFYPFEAVIRDNGQMHIKRSRLVSVAPPLESYTGRQVGTLLRDLANMADEDLVALLS